MANLVGEFWSGKHRNPPSQSPFLDQYQYGSLSPESFYKDKQQCSIYKGLSTDRFGVFHPFPVWASIFPSVARSENADIKPDLLPFSPSNFHLEDGGGKNGNASPRKGGRVGAFEPNWEVRRTSITPDQLAPLTRSSLQHNSKSGKLTSRRPPR